MFGEQWTVSSDSGILRWWSGTRRSLIVSSKTSGQVSQGSDGVRAGLRVKNLAESSENILRKMEADKRLLHVHVVYLHKEDYRGTARMVEARHTAEGGNLAAKSLKPQEVQQP